LKAGPYRFLIDHDADPLGHDGQCQAHHDAKNDASSHVFLIRFYTYIIKTDFRPFCHHIPFFPFISHGLCKIISNFVGTITK